MHKKLLVSWLFLLSGLFLFSYMNISGDMSGVTLTSGTYYVTGDLFVNAGTTFSLNPGVVIKFDPGYQLTVEGTLNAIGLSTPKIYFTSLDDNTIGQTISGSDGDPDPGDWDGIYFNGIGANEGICEMQYCQVKYGGSTTGTLLANISLEESDSGYFQDGVSRFSENFGILIYDCSPEISDSNIDNSGDAGIGIEDNCTSLISGNDLSGNSTNGILINDSLSYPEVSGNTIDFNGYYPIVCYGNQVGNFSNNTYSGNADQEIYVYGETITEDATWEDPDIPYKIVGDIYVQGQDGGDLLTTLTLEPGAELKFGSTNILRIGHDSNSLYPGALIAVGTVSDSIKFTADTATPSPGYWAGIYFANYTDDSTTELDYCIVEYGGYSFYENILCDSSSPVISNSSIKHGAVYGIYCTGSSPIVTGCYITNNISAGVYCNVNSDPVFNGCFITDNLQYGVFTDNSSDPTISACDISSNGSGGININSTMDNPTITGNTIDNNSSYPIRCYAGQVGNFSNNTYSGNTDQEIYVAGDTIGEDAVWEDPGIPYYLAGDVTVEGQDGGDNVTTLTLEENITMTFSSATGLWIGSNSSSSPGALVATASEGNEITFTGENPTPGYWDGIYFYDYADDSICQLSHCIIEYGGYSSNENIYCYYSSPALTDCDIRYGSGSGVFCYAASPVLTDCDIYDNTSYGVYCSTTSAPTFTGCSITDNISGGIFIYGSSDLTISSSDISSNGSYGIYLNSSADNAAITGNTFDSNSSYPIRCYASHVDNITGNTFSGITSQQIYVYGNTISEDATWTDQGIPYYISSSAHVYVQGTDGIDGITTLTLEPGVELDFDSTYLWIGHDSNPAYNGALIADGTEENNIIFTSNSSLPAAGDWCGIYFADYADDSTCILDYCIIEYGGNGATYDNIYCDESSPTLTNCEIAYGDGAGINTVNSSSVISDCIIHDNTWHGIYAQNSNLNFDRCLIYDNSNVGICNVNGYFQISHCTITANTTGYYASGTDVGTILNTIIWGNSSLGVDIPDPNSLDMTYSDCQNPWTGTGNLQVDPDFRDVTYNDYYLLYSSPCIDTGDPVSPLDPDGTRADMGVYAFDKSGGYPAISSISDVPDDQGRQVQIIWDRSAYDALGSSIPIENYSIWRYDEVFRTEGKSKIYDSPGDIFLATEKRDGEKYLWQRDEDILTYINLVPAMGFEQYSYIAPALHDSSAVSINYSKYIIFAHTDVTLMYFPSEPDSGYSLDNIPPIPARVDIVRDGTNINLSWEEVEYGEFEGNLYPEINGIWYKIYAGDIPEFICDETNLIDTVTDLEYDYPIGIEEMKFFKVQVSDKE